MLVPKMYRPRRAADVIEVVRRNPLALLASNGARTPFATHVPVIVDRVAAAPDGEQTLVGATLLGHMNRQNEHWRALREGGNVLVIFQGPHFYISPVAYEKRPAAPTWNFITVHLRGRVEPIDAGEPTFDVVTATVRALEGVAGTGWDMTGSCGYFRDIQPGVGAFRVHVESAEAMFKLSQEHPEEVRSSIRDHLAARGAGSSRELAEAMWSEETAAGVRESVPAPATADRAGEPGKG
ncbi:FMN-binding negative transcriptional regulator [Actinomadura opuntiae]|uniref:FMN-binding negative transcriptional regulator n=1 Tax=Actinomadura sp. OS1-43 TaxID=604315 RepID=UPI00255B28A1|nr:FMN-binding negative transcriptional regulator [Actinomadura sp. OS1-43]MDL4818696.1 FMN-binding negative transcriptional regulator [Actinomadura sp. OS1-43]